MKTKKYLMLIVAAITALSLTALVGCGGSADPEQQVKDAIAAEFDPVKNMSDDFISSLEDEGAFEGLDEMGVDGKEFATALFGGFDYAIGAVEIADDGKSATAEVTLTCKDIAGIVNNLEDKIFDGVDFNELLSMSEDEITQWAADRVMEILNDVDVVEQDPITLTLVNDGGTWEMDDNAEATLSKALGLDGLM